MINGENFFDQPTKDNKARYENIRKIATGKGNDYTTGSLLDYPYFRGRQNKNLFHFGRIKRN